MKFKLKKNKYLWQTSSNRVENRVKKKIKFIIGIGFLLHRSKPDRVTVRKKTTRYPSVQK